MIDASAAPIIQSRPTDAWALHRVWIAASCGAMLAGSKWVLEFWPLSAVQSLGHALHDLLSFSQMFSLLPLAAFILGLSITALISLWRGHFRQVTSSILGIAAIPVCFIIVLKSPVFDPWLWYAVANYTRFEALAAKGPPSNEPIYAVVGGGDVSAGLAGATSNHFVLLIYDESDAVGLDPSTRPSIWRTRSSTAEGSYTPIPKGRHLYGHLFRVDEFE